MSRLSFKSFCIENYAEHRNMNSSDVYFLFEKTDLLALLDTDYEDLHGMSFEYLMNFFDEYLQNDIGGTNSFDKHNYDITIGNIADDNVGETISFVMNGVMRKEDALERLKFQKINNQICFNTQKSLEYLKFKESRKV